MVAESGSKYAIFGVLLTFFIVLGVTLAYVNDVFPTEQFGFVNMSNFIQGKTSGLEIVSSIIGVIFWTGGALPLYVDMFLLILRTYFAVICYQLFLPS